MNSSAPEQREIAWPRVYRMRRGTRYLAMGVGLLALLGSLLGGGACLLGDTDDSPAVALLGVLLAAGSGAFLVCSAHFERAFLSEDSIEFVSLLARKRRLYRVAISGLRRSRLQGWRPLVFEFRDGSKPFHTLELETDAVLDAWLGGIPDLDAAERAAAEAALLSSPAWGLTEADRRRSLERARWLSRGLTALALSAGLWALIYPRPYGLSMGTLAAVQVVAIAALLLGGKRFLVQRAKNDPRPGLSGPLFFPGCAMSIRVVCDLTTVDWEWALAGAVACGLVLVAAICAGDWPARRRSLLDLVFALLFSAGGCLFAGNALLDRSEPEVFETVVREKFVSTNGRRHELVLAPFGPVVAPTSPGVSPAVHGAVAVGDVVCVDLYPGALGLRWFSGARPCSQPRR